MLTPEEKKLLAQAIFDPLFRHLCTGKLIIRSTEELPKDDVILSSKLHVYENMKNTGLLKPIVDKKTFMERINKK